MRPRTASRDFYCPHCKAGPFPTRDAMRKHIFDAHVKKS